MARLLLMAPGTLTVSGNSLNSLAALATYVEDKCEVMVLGLGQSLVETLKSFRPDIVGISSYTYTYPEAIETMRQVRAIRPEALRLIGGVHITSAPWSLDPVFDAGIMGDGEIPLSQIVEGHDLASIDGVCLPGGTFRKPVPIDPSQLPVPLLHKYAPGACRGGIVGLFTSRGCPNSCVFCYSKLMRPVHEDYPVEWVVDNFQYAIESLGANHIMLWDDCIFDAGRVHEIADEMKRRKISGLRFSVNVTGSRLNRELAEAFSHFGVVSWNTGFESGSDRMLALIKGRSSTVEGNKQLVALAHEFGADLNGSFILGMPGEKVEDMEMTLDFMEFLVEEKKAGRHRGGFWWFTATPFPGTPWWDIAERSGIVDRNMDWSRLNFANSDQHLLLDESVSEDEWLDVVRRANGIVSRSNIIFSQSSGL